VTPFELVLFYTSPDFARRAVDAGMDTLIIDWEHRNKQERQAGVDTQINSHTVAHLKEARNATDAPIICRLNGVGDWTADEVEAAIENGANEILLPMVRTVGEVEGVLDRVQGRCGVGLMIETQDAVRLANSLSRLPISRAYIGLHDLGIDRKSKHLFEAIADGTVQHICEQMPGARLGFAGLTLPDKGHPLPCQLLIDEMARLNFSFSFLRRSFMRDIEGKDLAQEISRIRQALQAATERSPAQVESDRRLLVEQIEALPQSFWRI
jgi:hypothetical protein